MSARLQAVVERLGVRPADRVLEIGCGHGIAAGLICERLVTGHLLAIDRSATMIAAARRRNRAHLAAGRLALEVADVETFDPGRRRFDKILAVRVGLFHREPARARALVMPWLARGGRLLVEYDEPSRP